MSIYLNNWIKLGVLFGIPYFSGLTFGFLGTGWLLRGLVTAPIFIVYFYFLDKWSYIK